MYNYEIYVILYRLYVRIILFNIYIYFDLTLKNILSTKFIFNETF